MEQVVNNNSPLLSICVPTYNRPEEFKRMMQGLLPQLTSDVEVVVRDDSSNLETKLIFENLIAGNSFNHRYFKGGKIGVDAANLFLIENASGNYIWSFSDDDEVRDGAISRILELISNYRDIQLIWVNFDYEKAKQPAYKREDGFFENGEIKF